jgi:hypothetical protein
MLVTTQWAASPKFPESSLWAWYHNVRKFTDLPIKIFLSRSDYDTLTPPRDVEDVSFHISRHPDWKIWWGKIELFAEQTPQLFIDIDTRLTKRLDAMAIEKLPFDLVMLWDERHTGVHGGGVLFIRPSPLSDEIYNKMIEWGNEIQKAYVLLPHHFGDQGYISQTAIRLGKVFGHWQDVYPTEFYCATPDTFTGQREYRGETFVYISGEPTLHRLDDPSQPWNR